LIGWIVHPFPSVDRLCLVQPAVSGLVFFLRSLVAWYRSTDRVCHCFELPRSQHPNRFCLFFFAFFPFRFFNSFGILVLLKCAISFFFLFDRRRLLRVIPWSGTDFFFFLWFGPGLASPLRFFNPRPPASKVFAWVFLTFFFFVFIWPCVPFFLFWLTPCLVSVGPSFPTQLLFFPVW